MQSKQVYQALASTQHAFGHLFLLLIRLYWGYLLFMIGLSKWTGLSETTELFTNLNIPLPAFSAWLAGLIELVGGACLFLGLFSRVMSLILALFFLIAYGTAHPEAITSILSTPNAFIEASHFSFFLSL